MHMQTQSPLSEHIVSILMNSMNSEQIVDNTEVQDDKRGLQAQIQV